MRNLELRLRRLETRSTPIVGQSIWVVRTVVAAYPDRQPNYFECCVRGRTIRSYRDETLDDFQGRVRSQLGDQNMRILARYVGDPPMR